LGHHQDTEKNRGLKPGDLLVDLTSCYTAIGLSAVVASPGYRPKFYLRNVISKKKLSIVAHYGAEVVLIDSREFVGPGAIDATVARRQRQNRPRHAPD
jgi:cysteine synthase